MLFNLNEFLIAVSYVLDFVEMDILGVVTNHSKRVAYISMKIAEKLGLSKEEIFDTVSLSILHDNGASEKILHDRLEGGDKNIKTIENICEHGVVGERNVKSYPFLTDVQDVIKYHHENYDGTGFFNIKGDDIPIMSQIIRLADTIELNSHLKETHIEEKQRIVNFVKNHQNTMFAPKMVDAFCEITNTTSFWLDLKDEFINNSLKKYMPSFSKEMTLSEIHSMAMVFSKIIDSKSEFTQEHSKGLSERVAVMAQYYKKSEEETYRLMIAAALHDVGKLAVSNSILDKPGKLDDREFDIIKHHPYYTRISLQEIKGFEDITEWASNHHEKLDGKGYPYGKTASELDFNSRLMTCLDIYQALMEERPYRQVMRHNEAMSILYKMSANGEIDGMIVEDVDRAFKDAKVREEANIA